MKKAGFKAALTAVALAFSGLALAQGMPAPNPAPAAASPPGYDSRPEPGQKPAMHQGQRKHMMKEEQHRKHMKDKHHMRPGHEGAEAGQSMPMQGQAMLMQGQAMPMQGQAMPMQGQAGSDMQGQGAGPDHSFYKGGRLPQEYRNRQYVVDNWRDHNLTAPPRGHQWIQTGADYVLVGTSTGVIAQVMLAP